MEKLHNMAGIQDHSNLPDTLCICPLPYDAFQGEEKTESNGKKGTPTGKQPYFIRNLNLATPEDSCHLLQRQVCLYLHTLLFLAINSGRAGQGRRQCSSSPGPQAGDKDRSPLMEVKI